MRAHTCHRSETRLPRDVQDPVTQDCGTPLHVAAEGGNVTIINMLLNAGARPGVSDALGQLPLHYAAKAGSEAAVEALMEVEPLSVLAHDQASRPCKIRFCCSGQPKFLPRDHGQDGRTALMHAAKAGKVGAAQVLLRGDPAQVQLVDKDGYSALQLAEANGDDKITEVLVLAGAVPDYFESILGVAATMGISLGICCSTTRDGKGELAAVGGKIISEDEGDAPEAAAEEAGASADNGTAADGTATNKASGAEEGSHGEMQEDAFPSAVGVESLEPPSNGAVDAPASEAGEELQTTGAGDEDEVPEAPEEDEEPTSGEKDGRDGRHAADDA